MSEITTSSGIRVEHADDLVVEVRSEVPAGLARGGAFTRTPGGDDWVGPLKAAGFEIVDSLAFEPVTGAPLRAAPGAGAAAATVIDVPVSSDTGAVVLLEVDGIYHWAGPSEDVAAPGLRVPGRSGPAKRFTLAAPTAAASPSALPSTRGPVFEWIVASKPFRAIVLRYALAPAARRVADWLDGDGPFGLCDMSVDDAALWRPGLVTATKAPAGAQRVLLFVHGTFSSTRGSFGDLLTHAPGRALLAAARARYDLVLGFEHATLSVSPRQNAEDLAAALAKLELPLNTVIDAVAFSRGGLVLRAFIEQELVARAARLPLKVGKMIFVACTNGGTHLAASANWGALVDQYATLCLTAARATATIPGVGQVTRFAATAVPVIGRLVQLLTISGVNDQQIPGLAAMEPGSELITALNSAAGRPTQPGYHAITANFAPGPLGEDHSGLALQALGKIAADLFKADNDLVVDTASMTTFWAGAELEAVERFGTTHDVYHTCYFASERVAERLAEWLGPEFGALRNAVPAAIAAPAMPRGFGATRGLPVDAIRGDAGGVAASSSEVKGALLTYDLAATVPPQIPIKTTVPLSFVVSRGQIDVIGSDTIAKRRIALLAAEPLQLRVAALENCTLVENGVEVDGAVRMLDLPSAGASRVEQFTVRGGGVAGPARLAIAAMQAGKLVCEFELKPNVIADVGALLSAKALAFIGTSAGRSALVLRIFQTSTADGRKLRFLADCPDANISLDHACEIDIEPAEYAKQRFADIERIVASTSGFLNATRRLRDHGAEMGDRMIPDEVRDVIWSKRAELAAIQVISDETPIPWELACVRGPGDEEPIFLAELGLVRWIKNAGWPADRLRLDDRKVCFLAPAYAKPGWELPGAQEEVADLLKLFPAAVTINANVDDFRNFLAGSNSIDVLHVACHGAASGNAAQVAGLYLTESADDVFGNVSVRQALRLAPNCNPIVFLNACQVGRPGAGISGVDGFAQAFLAPRSNTGAAVVVAPLWSAGDLKARAFAQAFYRQLLKGDTLVDAVRAARGLAKAQSELTWLSYSVYGDPFARVTAPAG
jgi:hypothetical protein